MSFDGLFPREREEVAPGAVHLPDWLSAERQRELLEACREWAKPPAGLRTVRTPGGGQMSVKQFSLGRHWGPVPRCPNCGQAVRQSPQSCVRHWYPYGYASTVVDGGGEPVKPFPAWLGEWARRAVDDAEAAAGGYGVHGAAARSTGGTSATSATSATSGTSGTGRTGGAGVADGTGVADGVPGAHGAGEAGPRVLGSRARGAGPCAVPYDIALVNFYGASAHMGMHRDSDERSDAPVVSFSLGDSCVFRFGTPEGRGRPWRDVPLSSGDAFVFGGPSRLAYHGVPRTEPGSGPQALGLRGRVNVTVRAY